MTAYWAARAVLPGGVATGVVLDCDGEGRLAAVRTGCERPPPSVSTLGGLVVPGLVDSHSHAFHRALRGRAGGGDFWAWRSAMYALVDRLDPDSLRALATAAFAELVEAGVSTVHEFHYLHRPAGMDDAICEAARRAGIRLVLLDTCYLRAGFDGAALDPVQQRFCDGNVERWAARADDLAARHPDVLVGAAIHSVRAVDPPSMTAVADWAGARAVPLHLHLSEQPAENAACLAATGRTPAQLAHDRAVLGPSTTAVHCTHLAGADIELLGATRTTACLCPTTERDLADGIGPAAALRGAGCPLRLGSDSHAVVDLFEEARAMEMDERLATGRRGHHRPEELLAAATAGAALRPGEPADLCAVRIDGSRWAGVDPDDPLPMLVAAGSTGDVSDVVVAGRHVVRHGRHLSIDVASELRAAIAAVAG
ncbi:MAG TPA: formimidoylglutamate deiminase [Acidimicrobiales bacterium]|nr:formimidoylglutamate deiminase [Acidimicrobiales bacterium]